MRAWLIASAVLLLAFAPAPLPKRAKGVDDQARLVGTWHIRTIKWRGGDHYQAAAFGDAVVHKNDRVVISRGRLSFQASNGPSSGDRAFSFQLSGSGEVRSIDLMGANQKTRVLGLSELRGGVLSLSISTAADRPKSLTGDGDEIAFVLDRQ